MAEHEASLNQGRKPTDLVAALLSVAAVICLVIMGVHRVNGALWGKSDLALTIVGLVLLVAAAVLWREQLAAAFGSRGVQLQANATLVTLLTLGILILLNVVVTRRLGWVKADWTGEKYYSLAPQTQKVVRGLKANQAIEMFGMVPMDQYSDPRGRELQRKRLDEYNRLSDNLIVKQVDPFVDPEAQKIAREAGLSVFPGVVIRMKDNPQRVEAITSVDEAQLTRGLLKLLDDSQRKLYFLTGHGEAGLEQTDQQGLSKLKSMLSDERYECESLSLLQGEKREIPDDAAGLVAVWPKTPYQEDELQKLKAYLARGGRLLACLDPDTPSNLAGVLSEYGVQWHADVVWDQVNRWQQDPRYFASADYGSNEAFEQYKLSRIPVLFMRAAYLTKDDNSKLELDDAVKSTGSSYAEPDTSGLTPEDQAKAAGSKVNGPLTIVMTATTKDAADDEAAEDEDKQPESEAKQDEPRVRLVVIADGDFALNTWGEQYKPNLEATSNLLAWMTDNTRAIGIKAKNPFEDLDKRKITLDAKGRKWLFLLTFLLPLLLVLAAGIAVQIARR